MRIFSKFHDYYDTAIGYGIDPAVTYERKTVWHHFESDVGRAIVSIFGDWSSPFKDSPFAHWNETDSVEQTDGIVILFCGKSYVGVELAKDARGITEVKEFCYSSDDVEKFFKKVNSKFNKDAKKTRPFYYLPITKKVVDKFFENSKDLIRTEFLNLHFQLDSPVICIFQNSKRGMVGGEYKNWGSICLNPCLKDVQFFKCVDSFTAFQELSMFIGGVMGGKIPSTVEISNEDRIHKHGFNEWSFRKEKS